MKVPVSNSLKSNRMGPRGPMRCDRCDSIMVYEQYYGAYDRYSGWRCICCGDIIDRVILENRGARRSPPILNVE